MANSDSVEQIISNIVAYSERHGQLLSKYSLDFYLNYFDRTAIMSVASRLPPHQPLTQSDFIRTFLLHIDHSIEETLYLAISLKQLFGSILERTSSSSVTIEFSDFTNYLCEKISKDDLNIVVPAKRVGRSNPSEEVSEVDLMPPVIVQKVEQELPKIYKDMPKKNKKLEEKKGVGRLFYSKDHHQVIALGILSSSIHLYDSRLRQQTEVKPRESIEMDKEVGILSMAYCSRYHRIGAILTSGSLVFWEGSDNFTTQKNIPLKQRGDKIFYLSLLDHWITVDNSTLYFWNLKEEQVSNTIRIPEASSILDICEIEHLKSICISIVTASEEKLLLVYQQGRRKVVIDLKNSACHTLHYNRLTQSLIPLSYTNIVSVYTIQGQFDPELRYVLRGHKSIITCVDSLEHDTLMVTGDDMGEIRIWELTYMRCVQSVKLNKWLGGIRFIGDQLLYSDSRINLLKIEHFSSKPKEKDIALYQYYDGREKVLFIFTKKDVRKTDIKTGRIKAIFVLCSEDDEISAVVQIGDGFVIGNSRGELQHFNSDCNLKWQRQAHDGEVRQLLYDPLNRLIFSLGNEGRIVAWPERNTSLEEERKVIAFRRRQVTFMKLSTKDTLVASGNSQEKEVVIWNYEVLNLLEVLEMDYPVTAVTFS